jgi:hypothetical protein
MTNMYSTNSVGMLVSKETLEAHQIFLGCRRASCHCCKRLVPRWRTVQRYRFVVVVARSCARHVLFCSASTGAADELRGIAPDTGNSTATIDRAVSLVLMLFLLTASAAAPPSTKIPAVVAAAAA